MRGVVALAVLVVAGFSSPVVALKGAAEFSSDFFFGVAVAPAQSEDHLEDQWLAFARAGHVHSWKNISRAEDRLGFWSHPEVEIKLAAQTNVQVFRMGIDWTRLFPEPDAFNATAMLRYVQIVRQVRDAGLKVMMTLFHHSIPAWANSFGGWTSNAIQPLFEAFYMKVVDSLGHMVDYWVTFNEPHVFVGFTYCAGLWPPAQNISNAEQARCMLPYGNYDKAMDQMAIAHNAFAKYCRSNLRTGGRIGVAHNVANNVPAHLWDVPTVKLLDSKTKFPFIDAIIDNIDFIGLNYYGREIISGTVPVVSDEFEYSESGRCIDPTGLYIVLQTFWKRYSKYNRSIILTENGVSDATDILRPSYIAEHLLAIDQAIHDGINVAGYVHWTTSDNWEWVDGYCPKFGLVAVNRSADGLTRLPRPSFDFFASIAKSHRLTTNQRDTAWMQVVRAQMRNQTRPFCRSSDGVTSLDVPVDRPITKLDWRFKVPSEDQETSLSPDELLV